MISPGDSIRQDPGDFGADDLSGDLSNRTAVSGTAEMDKPKTEEAKERASRATQEAKDAVSRASADLASQARVAGDELRGAASRVAGEAKGRLSDQVVARKDAVVGQVSTLSAAVRDAADRLEQDRSPVAGYVRVAADGIDRVADHLQTADLRDLYTEAERFARRHPEVVLGGLFLVGVGIARFLKSSAEERRHEEAQRRLREFDRGAAEMRPIGQYGVGGYGQPSPALAYPGDISPVGPAAASVGPDDFALAGEQFIDSDASGYGNTSEFGETGTSAGSLGAGTLGGCDLPSTAGTTPSAGTFGSSAPADLTAGADDIDNPPFERAPR